MTFRARLLAAAMIVAVVPLAIVGWSVRRVVTERVTAQYRAQARTLADVIERRLQQERGTIALRLEGIVDQLANDNVFRRGVVQSVVSERGYVLDFARDAMRAAGFDALVIQDDSGRIVSSGHFRNAYGVMDPDLQRAVAEHAARPFLVETRGPERSFPALVGIDSVQLAGRWYTIVGGIALDSAFVTSLAAGSDLDVQLSLPTGADSTINGAPSVAEIRVPYFRSSGDSSGIATARFVVTQSGAPLGALRSALDRWFLGAALASAVLAALLATWMAAHVARPLAELADKTARVELDRLDVSFATDRPDEVGQLARLLDSMTERLRASVQRLREVERRAAVGDLARQVNHDVKNGLTPIRNVVRHLTQVVEDEPSDLPRVFGERRGTLEASIQYLERLAAGYAGLSAPSRPEPLDANAVIESVTDAFQRTTQAEVRVSLSGKPATVHADRLALRRVLENLVGNGVDSLEGGRGTVGVTSAVEHRPRGKVVTIVVADAGRGMTREELDRAFEGFYSTKSGGTGLGLTIVRRLVSDMGGSLRVETEPGSGTRCTIELPYGGAA